MIDHYGNEITWVPSLKNQTKSKEPKYKQIANAIERDIIDGILPRGSKLPPQRIIAYHLNMNHGTITKAYQICEEKGLIKGIIGKGTFVSSSAGIPVHLLTDHQNNATINLGMTLPLYETNPLIISHIDAIRDTIDYDIALKYCPSEGHIKHRYIACEWLKRYNINTSPDNIILTSGTQNALSTILITLFSRGDRIIVSEYTYTGLMSLANYLGIILIPVKMTSTGIDIEHLEQVCRRENAKGIYLLTDCHNPTTITLSEEKRLVISEIIKKYNLLLIEDATYSFSNTKQLTPISALIPENSFYIHGTSKSLAPTFRISYVIVPNHYVQKIKDGVNNLIWVASSYTAEIIAMLQDSGRYEEIIKTKLDLLNQRNQSFDTILKDYHYIPSETSLFRYVALPKGWNDMEIEKLALESGIQIFSANRFFAGTHSDKNPIRISVSSSKDIVELKKGLTILKEVLDSYQYGSSPII